MYESGYNKNLPTIAAPELIATAGPLFAGGKITCHVSFDFKSGKNNAMHRIETGILDGIKYSFNYTDGSGAVQGLRENVLDVLKDKYSENWDLQCDRDAMDDTHYCAMYRDMLAIGVYGPTSHFVSVGIEHFPSSSIALRVDKETPTTAPADSGFTSAQAQALIASLSKGDTVLMRYRKWPYDVNQDKRISLFGYRAALQIIDTLNKQIK